MPLIRNHLYCLSLALLLAAPLSALGAKLYKWVDDQGNVYYSDKVPPEHARQERSRLNERGIEVERFDAAKTKEELAREAELERLRKEQQRMLEEQQAADQVLLRTFRTEDDLNMARDGKLAAIDGQIGVIRGNIGRLQGQLEDMQKSAADMERQGEKAPERLLTDMSSVQRQIEENYTTIVHKEQDKQTIRDKYAADAERFRSLKNLNQVQSEEASEQRIKSALLESVVPCSDAADCDRVWTRAEAYVRAHAVTPLQMSSANIIMTAAPTRDKEYNLTVSRIRDRDTGKVEIFLDVQCRETPKAQEYCASEPLESIRQGFAAAVGTAE